MNRDRYISEIGSNLANLLSNKELASVTFHTLSLSAMPNQFPLVVENCTLNNCCVDPGTAYFDFGVHLRNVAINDLKHSGPLCASANLTLFENVVLRTRKKSSMLWITPTRSTDWKPQEYNLYTAWVAKQSEDISVMIDIREYLGDVEIYGVPTDKILTNAGLHVKIRLPSSADLIDGRNIESDFFRLSLRQMRVHGVADAVFRVPNEADGEFELAMVELERLRLEGLIMD